MSRSRQSAQYGIIADIQESLATISALVGASASHAEVPPQTRTCLDQVDAELRDLARLCDKLIGDDWARRPARATETRPGLARRPAASHLSEVIALDEIAAAPARPVAGPVDQPVFGGQDRRLGSLTRQERRILALIAQGYTNRQIGQELFLAEKTVKNYVSNLLRKLGLERRTQAAVYATRFGQGVRASVSPHRSADPFDLTVVPTEATAG